MTLMNRLSPDLRGQQIGFQPQQVKRILVVRSVFRMGSVILAAPAIQLLHRNFPAAQIDFVGPAISRSLFVNLPIDRLYEITRKFPHASWRYPALLKTIRAAKYDLAFEASGSSSALGSFIVGFSAARLRVGVRGKWDRWFNVRLRRPKTVNKYRVIPELIRSMGLQSAPVYPRLVLSRDEVRKGRVRMRRLTGGAPAPVAGIFAGGRRTRGKRWGKENFLRLTRRLLDAGVQPVVFVGPEQTELLPYFDRELPQAVALVFEPEIRAFATVVRHCDLFVACDSGPVHLACALGVRTVAIFLKDQFKRWAPPAELGRIVRPNEVSIEKIFQISRQELLEVSLGHGGEIPIRALEAQP
jgi:heptosyltransferase-3